MLYKDRNTLFPIVHHKIYELYKTQMQAFWTADEIDLSADQKDLKKMKPEERHLILTILAFFAQSDSIVNENLAYRFTNDINIPEAIQFYAAQIGIEAVHAETYAKMIDDYVSDPDEKLKLFNAIKNFPAIARKADWMKKWIKSQESYTKRLLAFAAVEGIFFSGSFCTIYWLKEQNKLPGLSTANDLIARDEGLHWLAAAVIYKELCSMDDKIKSKEFYLRSRMEDESVSEDDLGRIMREVHYMKKSMTKDLFKALTQNEVEEVIKEAVLIEKDFIKEALKIDLLGINEKLMSDYIEYVADIVVGEFGFKKIYNTRLPFDFMIKNDVRGKVNFFERRATEYVKSKREQVNFDTVNEDF